MKKIIEKTEKDQTQQQYHHRYHHRYHHHVKIFISLFSILIIYSIYFKVNITPFNSNPRIITPLPSLDLQSIPGYFIQDQPNQDPNRFQIYHPNSSFGLIDNQSPDRWIRFRKSIHQLINQNSHSGVKHKVIFIARHGQGFHNVAESKYGKVLWDCYWSEKNNDEELTWGPDSRLTDRGKSEARVAHRAWIRELRNGAPFPQLFISSPLSRAIETMFITGLCNSTFNNNSRTLIKENWRENIGLHTCDKRRSKEAISHDFERIEFEDGFDDRDLLWTKDFQETDKQLQIRIHSALTSLFLEPISSKLTYISITAHSGVISALLNVVGHQPWPTTTGGMIPLVIRATLKPTPTHPPCPGPSATQPKCPPAANAKVQA